MAQSVLRREREKTFNDKWLFEHNAVYLSRIPLVPSYIVIIISEVLRSKITI